MAQASLTPGPGNRVRDALEPDLVEATLSDDAGWVEVNWPGPCVVLVSLDSSGVAGDTVEVMGTSAFDGSDDPVDPVSLGAAVAAESGASTMRIVVESWEKYAALRTNSAAGTATAVVLPAGSYTDAHRAAGSTGPEALA